MSASTDWSRPASGARSLAAAVAHASVNWPRSVNSRSRRESSSAGGRGHTAHGQSSQRHTGGIVQSPVMQPAREAGSLCEDCSDDERRRCWRKSARRRGTAASHDRSSARPGRGRSARRRPVASRDGRSRSRARTPREDRRSRSTGRASAPACRGNVCEHCRGCAAPEPALCSKPLAPLPSTQCCNTTSASRSE